MLSSGLVADWKINVLIEEPFRGAVAEDWLRLVVEATLRAEGVDWPLELGLVIAGEERLRELNRTYRGLDESTDVLTFSFQPKRGDAQPGKGKNADIEPFILPADGLEHLGEVIISYPHVLRGAREQGYSPERELAHLVIHGLLYLLGYGGEGQEREQRIRAVEKVIWGQ